MAHRCGISVHDDELMRSGQEPAPRRGPDVHRPPHVRARYGAAVTSHSVRTHGHASCWNAVGAVDEVEVPGSRPEPSAQGQLASAGIAAACGGSGRSVALITAAFAPVNFGKPAHRNRSCVRAVWFFDWSTACGGTGALVPGGGISMRRCSGHRPVANSGTAMAADGRRLVPTSIRRTRTGRLLRK